MTGHLLSTFPSFGGTNKAKGFGTNWTFWETLTGAEVGVSGNYPFGFSAAALARIFYTLKTLTVTSTVPGSLNGTTSIYHGFQPIPTVRAGLLRDAYDHRLDETIGGFPCDFVVRPSGFFYDGLFYPHIRYQSVWLDEGEPNGFVSTQQQGMDEVGAFTFLGQSGILYGDLDAEPPPSGDVTITAGDEW